MGCVFFVHDDVKGTTETSFQDIVYIWSTIYNITYIYILFVIVYIYIYIYSRILYIPWTWTQQHLVFEGLKSPAEFFDAGGIFQSYRAPVSQVANHDQNYYVYIYIYIPWAPPNLHFLEVFMVNNLVFRWPKLLFFHGFGGSWYMYIYIYMLGLRLIIKLNLHIFRCYWMWVYAHKEHTPTIFFTHTWIPNNLYFWRSTPQNMAFSNKNNGHLGFRYIILHQ